VKNSGRAKKTDARGHRFLLKLDRERQSAAASGAS
jgi:hypothetical protein